MIFPSPETIANLHVENLQQLKMTTRKCEYLIGIAKLITERKLSKEDLLQTQDVKVAEKQLTAIHGIDMDCQLCFNALFKISFGFSN